MKRFFYLAVLVLPILVLIRCGSSSSSTDNSAAIPQLAIASPMAVTTATRSVRGEDADTATEIKPFLKAKEELKDILKKDTPTGCFAGVGFKSFSKDILCYGPNLVVQTHPDGNFSGPSSCPVGVNAGGTADDGCLPSGDLGIWTEKEGATEACAAAKANQLVGDVAESINNAMKFMAAMTCVAELSGKGLPAAGASVDLATDVTSALPGSTVTTATITRKPDYTATTDPVYELVLQASVGAKNFKVTLVNSVGGSDKFRGRIYGYHSIGASATEYRGFSAMYEQSSASDLKVVTKMGITPATAGTSFFSANGDYLYTLFTSTAGSGNGRYLIVNLDPTTGLGSVKFAWQAGQMDGKARVFHASASRSARGDSGFGYFGFGPNVSSASLGDMAGMCCNWAGPSNTCMTGGYNTTNVQGQSFLRAAATDVFAPSTTKITFAPTNSCNYSTGSGFKFGTLAEWGASGGTVSSVAVTSTLDTQTAVGTMPTLVAPVFAP